MGNTYAEKLTALGGGLVRAIALDASVPGLGNPTADNSGRDGFTMNGGAFNPQAAVWDATIGGVKFTIAPFSTSESAGQLHYNFAADHTVQYGEGETFYVQFQQKLSRDFAEYDYANTGEGGWKHSIIGQGDPADSSCVYGGTTTGCAHSHSDIEHVFTARQQTTHFPIAYHDNLGSSYGLEESFPPFDIKLQNAIDPGVGLSDKERYCLYSSRADGVGNYGGCVEYHDGFPDGPSQTISDWATITQGFHIGTLAGASYLGMRYESWWAWEGETVATKMHDVTYDQVWFSGLLKFGKVWLVPFMTNKDHLTEGPESYTWYKNIIISTTQPVLITDEVAVPSGNLALFRR